MFKVGDLVILTEDVISEAIEDFYFQMDDVYEIVNIHDKNKKWFEVKSLTTNKPSNIAPFHWLKPANAITIARLKLDNKIKM